MHALPEHHRQINRARPSPSFRRGSGGGPSFASWFKTTTQSLNPSKILEILVHNTHSPSFRRGLGGGRSNPLSPFWTFPPLAGETQLRSIQLNIAVERLNLLSYGAKI